MFEGKYQASHGYVTIEIQYDDKRLEDIVRFEGRFLKTDVCAGSTLIEATPTDDALLTHLHHEKFEIWLLLHYCQVFFTLCQYYWLISIIYKVDNSCFDPILDLRLCFIWMIPIVIVNCCWTLIRQLKLIRYHIKQISSIMLSASFP